MADAIAPASMHILCIALRYNKPNITYFLHFFNKTRASVLSLGFRYLLRNIHKRIQNCIKFQYSVVSLFIDSGADLVLSVWFVLALVLNSANDLGVVSGVDTC